jgi:hypothetical protein
VPKSTRPTVSAAIGSQHNLALLGSPFLYKQILRLSGRIVKDFFRFVSCANLCKARTRLNSSQLRTLRLRDRSGAGADKPRHENGNGFMQFSKLENLKWVELPR